MADETHNTRDRILDACLRLFNESSPAAISTAEIARNVGINEGNLYYYFKKKEDILVALFERFEQALNAVANAATEQIPGPAYLEKWFNLMWEWRFFYRDTAAIKRMAPKLHARGMALAEHGQVDVKRTLLLRVKNGFLDATPDEIDKLVVNAWILSSYWLDYLHSRHNVDKVTREHIDWGLAQVLSLFEPYTTRARKMPDTMRNTSV